MRAAIVGMGQEMIMLMDMAVDDGISNGENCSGYHQSKGDQVNDCQLLLQEYERQEGTDEWRKSIIGTRTCRADAPLGIGVEENAESVGHKS